MAKLVSPSKSNTGSRTRFPSLRRTRLRLGLWLNATERGSPSGSWTYFLRSIILPCCEERWMVGNAPTMGAKLDSCCWTTLAVGMTLLVI